MGTEAAVNEGTDESILYSKIEIPGKERPNVKRSPLRRNIFISVLIFINVAVIAVSIAFLVKTSRQTENEECSPSKSAHKEPVSALCVACEDAGELAGKMKRYDADQEQHQDMCCPMNYQQIAVLVEKIYTDVRQEKQEEFLRREPEEPYTSSLLLFSVETSDVDDTLWYANRAKPAGHITGLDQTKTDDGYYTLDQKDQGPPVQVVENWHVRTEPYRSMSSGYVQRLTWGISVPATGLFRVHSSVNFYFGVDNVKTQTNTSSSSVAVVHQLQRYSVSSSNYTVLADTNNTISTTYRDGVSSFLVTLARLEVGDVIVVSVSHPVAMGMQDRWHSEGLVFVE